MDKIPYPKEFFPTPGDPVLPFKHWIKLFDNFLYMKNASLPHDNKLTSEDKNRFLFTLLGFEGIRIFTSNPMSNNMSTASHQDFKTSIKEIFDRPVNPFKAYYDFECRNQHSHETTQEYLTALRSLMADCDFGARENHHLAVRLVCGCYNKDTQKKLLALKKVDIDEVLGIMQAEETANQSVSAISRNAVRQIDRQKHDRQREEKKNNTSSTPQTHKPCSSCGRQGHTNRDKMCPAKGRTCNACGKNNHFSSVCRSKKSLKTLDKMCAVGEVPYSFTIRVRCGKTVVPITAQVDTGSQVTGITNKCFKRHFSGTRLEHPVKLRNFDGTTLASEAKGRFYAEVLHNDRCHQVEMHVLPNQCDSVIGQDVIRLLGLQIDGASQQVRSITKHQLLNEFPRLLSDEMGTYPDYQHKIEISETARPVAQKLRPVPLARRQSAADEVKAMDSLGIWEATDKSQWVHHMVTVPKPCGGVRITSDLSPLNTFVIPDRFPLPNPKDLFLELKGAKIFSKLDLRKAFYHIELAPESRQLTTTLTHQGLRQYKRLPMGLKDSASVCQRLVSQTLAGCPGTICYVDDILVFGVNQEEHDANLRTVLKQLEAKDFRLQKSKCQISVSEITFLGHIVSASGIRPDPKNVDPIKNAKQPRTVKQIASFLGMVNYYSDFIPKLATLAEPLRRLQRKNVKFVWSQQCQNAFDKLKAAISEGVKMFIFDPNAPTFVSVDASDVGIGGVLSQIQNGREVPIAHASHTLQERERAYAVNEKEALACVWACETWEKYLLGRHFTLRTDHSSLVSLLQTSKDTRKSAKFCRWLERLSVFDYTVEYREGSQNVVADALSRLSVPSSADAIQDPTHEKIVRNLDTDNMSLKVIEEETKVDQTLSLVMKYVSNGWPKKIVSTAVQPYHRLRNEISADGGFLLRGERIILPASLQRRLLKKAHDGHPGIVRMKRQLRRSYWWPGQDKAVEEFVRHCSGCQKSDKSVPPAKVPTSVIPPPTKPWHKLAMDIAGPFAVAPDNQRFVVVLMDYYSKYPEILSTGAITSRVIIKWLDDVFSRYGLPEELVTDNGTSFTSKEFTDYLEHNNVRHLRTSVYSPNENGLVERFNRYLKTHVQAFVAENKPWHTGMNALLRHYRATSPTATGLSPCQLMFGRNMRLPHEMPSKRQLGVEPLAPLPSSPSPPTHQGPQQQSTLLCRGPYRVGDTVLTKRPQVLKGQSSWSNPKQVLQVLGNYTYSPDLVWVDAALSSNEDFDPRQAAPRRSSRQNRGVPPLRYPP